LYRDWRIIDFLEKAFLCLFSFFNLIDPHMKHIIRVLIISTFFISSNLAAQKIINCGLITKIALLPTSKIIKPTASDVGFLSSMNNELNVASYMNKMFTEGSRKVMVSLFTNGTETDLINKINASKFNFLDKEIINKGGVRFTCYNFKFMNCNIARIIFNEPELTLCVLIDVSIKDSIIDYNEIINRVSFIKSKK